MIPLQEAQQLVSEQAHSFGKEKIQLDDAVGRVLCQQIIADRDYPPFNRATIDGIAINMKDWENGTRSFIVVETIFAGSISAKIINAGDCYKIMTGAALPAGADTIIRREDIEGNGNRLTVTVSDIKGGQNIAAKGTDILKGTVIIELPQLIKPGTITTLASLGYAEVEVEKLPCIAIITTGDEVVNIDALVNEVQIRNSNAHLLKALLQQWKITPTHFEHVKDDAAILLSSVKQQLHHDIIIFSGAVSAGDADFVPEVLMKAGAKKIFHKVAIRPGKPIWFGVFENGPVVFALPGNPFSTMATFKLFIESFLYACFGISKPAGLDLPLNGNRHKKTNLDEFFPVSITGNPSSASALHFNTSGDITAVLHADALALHPADKTELVEGDIVSCIVL